FVHALDRLAPWRVPHNPADLRALLLHDERLAAARLLWPEGVFPDLYRDVPDDVARPPYEDGRLIGRMHLAWLSDRHMTEEALRSGVRVAATMGALAFIALALATLLSAAGGVIDAFGHGGHEIVAEQWPGQEPAKVSGWAVARATLPVVGMTVLRSLGNLGVMLPGLAVVAVGLALLALLMLLRSWHHESSVPYMWPSKDADVRW